MVMLNLSSQQDHSLSTSEMFKGLLRNLQIDDEANISLKYGELTSALNQEFRSTDSKTANSLQVGSYGRSSGIKGISDLDMLYIMPAKEWENFRDGGQYSLLLNAKKAIKARYPRTTVKVDRLVVSVLYNNFQIEVQPVFEQSDGSFLYPDTKNGGAWKTTKPKLEIKAMSETDAAKNKNLRRLCKMSRAWKNKHGLKIGGLLIDTLAFNFLSGTDKYDETSYSSFPKLLLDFFEYLSNQPDQAFYFALGSNQRVAVKKKFQRKAQRAYDLCVAASVAQGQKGEYKKWRKLFGRLFPSSELQTENSFKTQAGYSALDTEQFIEDRYNVDIRYNIEIDCTVSQDGFRPSKLLQMVTNRVPLLANKSLSFIITTHDIPDDFVLYWKVLNSGPEAIRRNCLRGKITADAGQMRKNETTNFKGDHVVECYAVLNNVVVARDRILVPISNNQENVD